MDEFFFYDAIFTVQQQVKPSAGMPMRGRRTLQNS